MQGKRSCAGEKEEYVSKQVYHMGNPGLKDGPALFTGATFAALFTYSEHRHPLEVFQYSCQQCMRKLLFTGSTFILLKSQKVLVYKDYISQH